MTQKKKNRNASHLKITKETKRALFPDSPENSLFSSETGLQEVYKGLFRGTRLKEAIWTEVALNCNTVAAETLAVQVRLGSQALQSALFCHWMRLPLGVGGCGLAR